MVLQHSICSVNRIIIKYICYLNVFSYLCHTVQINIVRQKSYISLCSMLPQMMMRMYSVHSSALSCPHLIS